MAEHLFGLRAELLGILSPNSFPNLTRNTFNFIDLGGPATPRRILLERKAADAGTFAL
jgi:hypothetical protein